MSRRRATHYFISALLVLVLSVLGAGYSQQGKPTLPKLSQLPAPGTYSVTHVTDGDTFNVSIVGKTETVRMIGIDTPETKDPRKPVQCFGQAASSESHKLLDGKSVRLEADPDDTDRDKYHRLLRYVYLPDGTFVNQYLVQNGYAFAYTLFPFSKVEQFRAWESEARQNNRGLWSGCQIHKEGDKEQTQDQ